MWGPDEDEPPPLPTKEALESALAKLDADRDDIIDMRRGGLITQEKAKERLARLNQEGLCLKRQLDNLAHKEESDRKLLALMEREVAQLDALKARMIDADDATKHDTIKRLLIEATVETRGEGRHKTGTVHFRWWYTIESVEVVPSRNVRR